MPRRATELPPVSLRAPVYVRPPVTQPTAGTAWAWALLLARTHRRVTVEEHGNAVVITASNT